MGGKLACHLEAEPGRTRSLGGYDGNLFCLILLNLLQRVLWEGVGRDRLTAPPLRGVRCEVAVKRLVRLQQRIGGQAWG